MMDVSFLAPLRERLNNHAVYGALQGVGDLTRPHVVAAAFALGREHVIPNMFRAFLAKMSIGKDQAPAFHYYLERHIHLDETSHAPLSLKMLEELGGGDAGCMREAEAVAAQAVETRIKFWSGSGVHEAILAGR